MRTRYRNYLDIVSKLDHFLSSYDWRTVKEKLVNYFYKLERNESLDNVKYVNIIFVPLHAPLNKEESWANISCLMFIV